MKRIYPVLLLCITLSLAGYGCKEQDTSTSRFEEGEPDAPSDDGLPEWAIGPFTRVKSNPILSPLDTEFYCPMNKKNVKWEESDVFNPAATVKNGKIVVLYRAEDNSATGIGLRTSRIGYAESIDGVNMSRLDSPILYPKEDDQKAYDWKGGCEDPRVTMTEDGTYVMLYTGWNRDNVSGVKKVARLCVATSKDLINWTKRGVAFSKAYNGRFLDLPCKSGSMVTKIKNGKLVAEKINGKYFMYWGETAVYAATSEDLINWEPILDDNNELYKIIIPRNGYFDSRLTECGPPAIMTDKGIVLIYNGKNEIGEGRDTNYPAGTYAAGQLLLDAKDPLKPLERLDKPFFWPEADFEKSGQYPDGTVFTEGLTYLNGKLYMYYGCADSFVALATCNYPAK